MKRLKKLLILTCMVITFAAVFAFGASAAEIAYGAATVSATSLNIRSGPSTDDYVLTVVSKGTRIVILDKGDGKWFHVNYQGEIGYVDSDYLEEILLAENFNATGTLTATDVNMRAKPSTDSDIMCRVDIDTVVDVIGINNGWFKVVHNGSTGYIRSDLMEVTGAPSHESYTNGVSQEATANTSLGQQIANFALQFLGYKYVYSEESPAKGFDCSGLTYYVYGEFGYDLSRTASQQYKNNGTSVSKDELQQGDLVFFSSNGGSSVTHVGIYIGDGQFVHASTSTTGVIISDLSSAYYTKVWYGAKRII